MNEADAAALARFLYEAGHLKNAPRSGWLLAGVPMPESVAAHSFRVALIAALLARMTGADPGRAALLAIVHDIPEARTTDLHKVAQRYLPSRAAALAAGRDQAESLPEPLRDLLSTALLDLTDTSSPEALLARDADKLDCLLQAREYAACGHPTAEWVESSLAALSTDAARSVARAAMGMDPFSWWKD